MTLVKHLVPFCQKRIGRYLTCWTCVKNEVQSNIIQHNQAQTKYHQLRTKGSADTNIKKSSTISSVKSIPVGQNDNIFLHFFISIFRRALDYRKLSLRLILIPILSFFLLLLFSRMGAFLQRKTFASKVNVQSLALFILHQ